MARIGCHAVFGAALGAALMLAGQTRAETVLRVSFFRDNPLLASVDPFQVYYIEHRVELRNVAESLTDQDPVTGRVVPWLAKRWDISKDGLNYTFYLRDGVSFSNGAPFNAQAVKTAFDADKAFATSVPTVFGAIYLAGYDHADVIDDHTVKITLSQPNAGFLQATSTTNLAILAPESYTKTARERSLGAITGPFILEHYTPEVGVRLVKRHGYSWPSRAATNPGEAAVDVIDLRYVPEGNVRNGQFLQGQVDILWPREPFSAADKQLLATKGAQFHSRSLPGPAYNFYPNVKPGKVLADPVVRLALQKSLDRVSYARTIYDDTFPVVQSVYDVTTPFFKSETQKLAYDPACAAALLDKAGWTRGSDGYRYKDGKRLTLVDNLLEKETAGILLVQDQLRQAGFDLKLIVLAPGEWMARTSAGRYDLVEGYLTRGDPIVLQNILDPRYARRVSLANDAYAPETLAKAEKLFDAGLLATDDAERARVYAALQDLLIDEGVVFPLYERIWEAATLQKVQGFSWTSEGFALLNDIRLTP